MVEAQESETFFNSFSKGLISGDQAIFRNIRSRKVLANLAEFLIKEKKEDRNLPSTLLTLSLQIDPRVQDVSFARNLYLLGFLFSKEQMFVRGEGLFANARELLEPENAYEKVEMYFLFGNMLRQLESRRAEADRLVEKGREEAAKMPPWYPYLVNLAVTDIDIN